MWQPCCSRSPMIARRPKGLVVKCEFCSSCWGFLYPLRWALYWAMDTIMARLPSRHDIVCMSFSSYLQDIFFHAAKMACALGYKVSQRRYRSSARPIAPVVTNIIDKL
jgi:hypothetical protein